MWTSRTLTDKSQILAYLETDRLYAAYAIGDLEPGLFEQCEWVGAEKAGQLKALALHFLGLDLPALLLIGDADGLRIILREALCPRRVNLICRTEHLPVAREFYILDKPVPMWRMALRLEHFRPVSGNCVRLVPGHADQLTALYALGEGNAFSPAQMEQGIFYGIFAGDQLLAVGGTHLVSPTYGVAAVGNVFTRPDHRGQGHGTATTSAVVADLLQQGIYDIVLNVGQDNAVAIRIYERLGFERYCPYFEGAASVRGDADRREDENGFTEPDRAGAESKGR